MRSVAAMRILTRRELNNRIFFIVLIVVFGLILAWGLQGAYQVFFQKETINPDGVKAVAIMVGTALLVQTLAFIRLRRPKGYFIIDADAKTVTLYEKRKVVDFVPFAEIRGLTATSITEYYSHKGSTRSRTRYVVKTPAFEEYLLFVSSEHELRRRAKEIARVIGANLRFDLE